MLKPIQQAEDRKNTGRFVSRKVTVRRSRHYQKIQKSITPPYKKVTGMTARQLVVSDKSI